MVPFTTISATHLANYGESRGSGRWWRVDARELMQCAHRLARAWIRGPVWCDGTARLRVVFLRHRTASDRYRNTVCRLRPPPRCTRSASARRLAEARHGRVSVVILVLVSSLLLCLWMCRVSRWFITFVAGEYLLVPMLVRHLHPRPRRPPSTARQVLGVSSHGCGFWALIRRGGGRHCR